MCDNNEKPGNKTIDTIVGLVTLWLWIPIILYLLKLAVFITALYFAYVWLMSL